MIIAQISDPHIRAQRAPMGPVDTAACLEAAVVALNRLVPAPELVLLTGDLGNDGTDAEYDIAREILAPLQAPLLVIPGNHDRREPLARAFGHGLLEDGNPFFQYRVVRPNLVILALDTLLEGRPEGGLCGERLAWLERALTEHAGDRVVLVMHHPPVRTGILKMDAMRLIEGADRLESLVRRHGGVERILCGHVHRSIQRLFAGTLVQICPGVAHQMALELDSDLPLAFIAEPPAFLIHRLDGDGIATHMAVVDDFGPATTYASVFG